MLGSRHAHNDWILLANHFDMSFMRNESAFYLSRLLDGLDYTPFSRFVHLYINDEYMGVYQLTDERDVGRGRIELTYNTNPAFSEYLFELNGHVIGWLADRNTEGVDYFMSAGRAYDVRFPRVRLRDGHVEYLRRYVEATNNAIWSRDLEAISSMIDMPSFIDFYIIQELFKNIDVAEFSVFMTLRGTGRSRRLYFGPVWDFDRCAGNTLYWPEPGNLLAAVRHDWFWELVNTPAVFDLIAKRWNEIKDREISQMIANIRETAEAYQAEFERNFERFPMEQVAFTMPTNPLYFGIDSYMGHADYLTDWLNARVAWLDDYFNGRPVGDTGWFPDYDPVRTEEIFIAYRDRSLINIGGMYNYTDIMHIRLNDRIMLSQTDIEMIFGLDVNFAGITYAELGVSSVLIGTELYVPIRAVIDILGYTVALDAAANTIIIRE
jgi:hypothetical protein